VPKGFNFSISIKGKQDEVFKSIKNISNWYLFDFHDLIYLYNDTIIETKHGRGTLNFKCDEKKKLLAYSIDTNNEGSWKFEIAVQPDSTGAMLTMRCWGPRRISHQTFFLRTASLKDQLGRFKILVEENRRMN
jgi:hypothetical protein